MSWVTIRYWAAARDAAGATEERYDASTLRDLVQLAREHHPAERFAAVLGLCAFVVDDAPVGTRDHATIALGEGSVVEALPPFAGG